MSNELPAFTLDEILAGASLPEVTVQLCLNGKVRREYEEVKARIADRIRDEMTSKATKVTKTLAGDEDADHRLGVRRPAADDQDQAAGDQWSLDPEEPLLDSLLEQMRQYTVPFVVRAMPAQDWNRLVEAHPARKDPATNKRIEADWQGVNASTFYPPLVRASIASPAMSDEQWDRVRAVLTDAQFDKLATAATDVNRKDDDIPFSLTGLPSPPS